MDFSDGVRQADSNDEALESPTWLSRRFRLQEPVVNSDVERVARHETISDADEKDPEVRYLFGSMWKY